MEPKVIFDLGANIGLASVYFSNRYPEAKVLAVEPDRSNFGLLVTNTAGYPGVTPLLGAVWDKDIELKTLDVGLGHWGFMTSESGVGAACRGYSMSTLMDMAGVDHIDILKIDIEGAEKEVFENPHTWLPRVGYLVIEMHDRMKEGCTASVQNALSMYYRNVSFKGENLICQFMK